MLRRAAAIVTALGVSIPSVAAVAAPLRARVSEKGLAWVSGQVKSFIPSQITPPEIAVEMFQCSEGPARFVQKNTSVALDLHDFAVTLPEAGRIRIDLTLSATADGDVALEKIFACGLSAQCTDKVVITNLHVVADFSASIVDGKPKVVLESVTPNNDFGLDLELGGANCPGSDLYNVILDGAVKYGKRFAVILVQSMAKDQIQPILEDVLKSIPGIEQSVGALEIKAALSQLSIGSGAITLDADVDVTSDFPPAVCISEEASHIAAEPSEKAGPSPELEGSRETDLQVAVNLGLVDDAIFQVWRDGMMCMTPSSLEEYGVHLPLELIGVMLPGFPAGTTFSFEARVAQPPHVEGLVGDAAKVKVVVAGVEASVLAKLPDDSTRHLDIALDAEMVAEVRVDSSVNALALSIDRAKVTRITMDDSFGLESNGFDLAHIQKIAEDVLLPKIFGEMGEMPVTGPVFGGILDTYVILREVETNQAWLTARLDLFRAPVNDTNAPTTEIENRPEGLVNPNSARLTVNGHDGEIPTELLRYVVTVDGVATDPSYVRAIKVGQVGKSQKYRLEIAAMDLAGNVDATPEIVEIDVDGIAPRLSITTPLYGTVGTTRPDLDWSATDDRTTAAKMKYRLDLARAVATGGKTEIKPFQSIDLGTGTTRHELPRLEPGGHYQATLVAIDEAGNETGDAMLFDVARDADDGGCTVAVGGTTSATPAGLLLLGLGLALAFVRRRR
jgi:MYXO-CTERM domain-containing protein